MLICMLFALTACTYGKIDLGDGKYSQAAAIKGQGGSYKVGNPYKIMGTWYYPKEDYGYSEVGMASWYGEDFHAKKRQRRKLRYEYAHRCTPDSAVAVNRKGNQSRKRTFVGFTCQ